MYCILSVCNIYSDSVNELEMDLLTVKEPDQPDIKSMYRCTLLAVSYPSKINLSQNSQAVKKECGFQKGQG